MYNTEFCCYCNEPTGFSEGYMIWETVDGKHGHNWCVENYDKAYLQKREMEKMGKENWKKGYKEIKNVIHNDMGVTKDEIHAIFREIAKEEIQGLVGANRPFIKDAIREVVEEEMAKAIASHRYPKVRGNTYIYERNDGDTFQDYVAGVMKAEIVRQLGQQFQLNIDITKKEQE